MATKRSRRACRATQGGPTRSVSLTSIPFVLSKLPFEVAIVPKDDILCNVDSKVHDYIVGRKLGGKSIAEVKEAFHAVVGEKVAMKIIDKRALQDDIDFRREAKLLQMVRHPNIVQFLETIDNDNDYYIITELCSGGNLMNYINSKNMLDEVETRKYMRQIVSAVDHLHKAGIIHRDLKLENMLLNDKMDIKIIGFGMSNVEYCVKKHERVRCSTPCGSPEYAAPEILGFKEYGPEVDIWSIGVNMYAMLAGYLPYTCVPVNISVLHAKMLENRMNPIPDHLSEVCKDLLRSMLICNPDRRIKIDDIMKHPWMNEGHAFPFDPTPFPNHLTQSDINNDVIEHMVYALDVKVSEEEMKKQLTTNQSTSVTAIYHLFTARLARYNRQLKNKTMQHKSKQVPLDYSHFEGKNDDGVTPRQAVSSHARSRQTPWRLSRHHTKMSKAQDDNMQGTAQKEASQHLLLQRRHTLPSTVLKKHLSTLHRDSERATEEAQKSATVPRRQRSQEKLRDISEQQNGEVEDGSDMRQPQLEEGTTDIGQSSSEECVEQTSSKECVIDGDIIINKKTIGGGAFGSVFKGRLGSQPCAVKILHPHAISLLTSLETTGAVQSEALQRFKDECKFLERFQHPNVVRHLSSRIDPDSKLPVLVMELMDESLTKCLEKPDTTLSHRTQGLLSFHIASALHYLHSEGIIHRDLCSDNVLLLYDDKKVIAKISDFGMSRMFDPDHCKSLTTVGHREAHLPPEARKIESKYYDDSLDVFSFGVVVVQIVTKSSKIAREADRDKLVKQIEKSHPLCSLIHKCIQHEKERRPSAEDICCDLKAKFRCL